MNTVTTALQPSLPWTTVEEDRRFRRILVLSLLFFVLLAGLVSWLPVTPLQVAANMTPPARSTTTKIHESKRDWRCNSRDRSE